MSELNISPNELSAEGLDAEVIEISSDLSSFNRIDLDSTEIGVHPQVDVETVNFSTDDIHLESRSLDVHRTNLLTANIKILSGSIGEDGDGIRSIIAVETPTGADITITLSSGRVVQFSLQNGPEGKPGKDADIEGANRAIKAANEAAKKASSAATQAENVDAILQDETLTITDRTGQSKSVNVIGPPGPPGPTTPTDLSRYTLGEYLSLKEQGKLQNMFYSVYKGDTLYRVYLGDTLVGKKAEDGERVTVGSAFPLVFPIIFS